MTMILLFPLSYQNMKIATVYRTTFHGIMIRKFFILRLGSLFNLSILLLVSVIHCEILGNVQTGGYLVFRTALCRTVYGISAYVADLGQLLAVLSGSRMRMF